MRSPSFVLSVLVAAAALSSCDRAAAPGAASAQQTGSAVQPLPSTRGTEGNSGSRSGGGKG